MERFANKANAGQAGEAVRTAAAEKPIQKLLILRALQLGDMLCVIPALRAMRAAHPEARITLVGLPWAASFVRRFSHYLDDFIAFPGWPGLPEQEPHPERIAAFFEMVQAMQFDLAIQMHGAGTLTNPLAVLCGARQTAGYYLPGQFCPDPETFFPYPDGEHEIRIFTRLAQKLGWPEQGEALEFPVTEEEQATYETFRNAHHLAPGGYAVLHPGARFEGRRWPTERFAAVGDRLAGMGLQIVVTGAPAERPLTGAVTAQMHAAAIDAGGKTDLGTLALLLRGARLLVSNDTGVSHLAAAVQAPSVVLFTVSDPNRWRPLNERLHRIILHSDQASPEMVLAEAETVLRETREYASEAR
jgi:ADP-heptose:LPS heptosyltransferase